MSCPLPGERRAADAEALGAGGGRDCRRLRRRVSGCKPRAHVQRQSLGQGVDNDGVRRRDPASEPAGQPLPGQQRTELSLNLREQVISLRRSTPVLVVVRVLTELVPRSAPEPEPKARSH